jgi:peptidoglycan hydrolase-like protein with peptidoglycan-binding domain
VLTSAVAHWGPVLGVFELALRKKKKPVVYDDEPRSSKPLAVLFTIGAVVASLSVSYNTFFNQIGHTGRGATTDVAGATGSTHVTVTGEEKSSRTITLKYDELVEDVQRELLATGHFNGLVDGVTGPKTRVAIEAYQRENGIEITGEASKALVEHIRYVQKLNQAAEFTGSLAPKQIEQNSEVQPLAALPKPAETKAKAAATGDNAVLKLQQRLAKLGYDPGSRSGEMDEGTRSAILIFEMDHGMPMLGKISKELLTALKKVEVAPVAAN